jgi:hypothetical protein
MSNSQTILIKYPLIILIIRKRYQEFHARSTGICINHINTPSYVTNNVILIKKKRRANQSKYP